MSRKIKLISKTKSVHLWFWASQTQKERNMVCCDVTITYKPVPNPLPNLATIFYYHEDIQYALLLEKGLSWHDAGSRCGRTLSHLIDRSFLLNEPLANAVRALRGSQRKRRSFIIIGKLRIRHVEIVWFHQLLHDVDVTLGRPENYLRDQRRTSRCLQFLGVQLQPLRKKPVMREFVE